MNISPAEKIHYPASAENMTSAYCQFILFSQASHHIILEKAISVFHEAETRDSVLFVSGIQIPRTSHFFNLPITRPKVVSLSSVEL